METKNLFSLLTPSEKKEIAAMTKRGRQFEENNFVPSKKSLEQLKRDNKRLQELKNSAVIRNEDFFLELKDEFPRKSGISFDFEIKSNDRGIDVTSLCEGDVVLVGEFRKEKSKVYFLSEDDELKDIDEFEDVIEAMEMFYSLALLKGQGVDTANK